MIRPATLDDAPEICNLQIAAVETLCCQDYTPEQIEAWVNRLTPFRTRKVIESQREMVQVAETSHKIVGVSSWTEEDICALFVHPDYARRGIGRFLLQNIEKNARKNQIKQLKLRSSLTALIFYQACGFHVIEETDHILPPGVALPCAYMAKKL